MIGNRTSTEPAHTCAVVIKQTITSDAGVAVSVGRPIAEVAHTIALVTVVVGDFELTHSIHSPAFVVASKRNVPAWAVIIASAIANPLPISVITSNAARSGVVHSITGSTLG